MKEADIILATSVAAGKINMSHNQKVKFYPDITIIDEISQAQWADIMCFMILRSPRLVLCGDYMQLPPTVISGN